MDNAEIDANLQELRNNIQSFNTIEEWRDLLETIISITRAEVEDSSHLYTKALEITNLLISRVQSEIRGIGKTLINDKHCIMYIQELNDYLLANFRSLDLDDRNLGLLVSIYSRVGSYFTQGFVIRSDFIDDLIDWYIEKGFQSQHGASALGLIQTTLIYNSSVEISKSITMRAIDFFVEDVIEMVRISPLSAYQSINILSFMLCRKPKEQIFFPHEITDIRAILSGMIPLLTLIPENLAYYLHLMTAIWFADDPEYHDLTLGIFQNLYEGTVQFKGQYRFIINEFYTKNTEKQVAVKRSINLSITTCSQCGTSQSVMRTVCEQCKAEMEICEICKLAFSDTSLTLSCNYCKQYFHKSHILEWVKIKGFCPVCKKRLTHTDFQ